MFKGKHETQVVQFKSFTLLNHNPTLTTNVALPTFTVVQLQDSHTHPFTELEKSHSQFTSKGFDNGTLVLIKRCWTHKTKGFTP